MQEHLQDGFDVRFDWGPHAVRQAARRGDVVIVVDVLRFSLRGPAGRPPPEAALCRDAFLAASGRLEALLWECASGRELRTKGRGDDVVFSSALDRLDSVPLLVAGEFRAMGAA